MNWRLIIFSAVGAAVGINLVIILIVAILFYSGIFADKNAAGFEEYLISFALFSPLTASIISSAFVTFFSRSKKLLHTVFSTFISFALTAIILFYLTSPISLAFYDAFDRRINKVKFE